MADSVKKESKLVARSKNFAKFFREIRAELKRVIWPTREQLINNTATVLIFCVVIGLIIWVADFSFEHLTKLIFTKQ